VSMRSNVRGSASWNKQSAEGSQSSRSFVETAGTFVLPVLAFGPAFPVLKRCLGHCFRCLAQPLAGSVVQILEHAAHICLGAKVETQVSNCPTRGAHRKNQWQEINYQL